MEYWKEVLTSNRHVYSCDMVRLKFSFRQNAFEYLVKYFSSPYRIDIEAFPPSMSDFRYKYLYTISYSKSSMTVGIGFNGSSREDIFLGFAEFNPNKCFQSEQCFLDLQVLFCNIWKYELVRWDLAVDVPIGRKYMSLVKDGRRYETVLYSQENKTEYLGIRNEPGRVKLYNKALEDKYADVAELTRLELTCAGEWGANEIIAKLPLVDMVKQQSELNLSSELSNTQRVLVELINASDAKTYYFKLLNASMQVKLRPYIFGNDNRIEYDRNAIDDVLRTLRRTLKNFEDGVYIPVPDRTIPEGKEVNPFEEQA